MEMLPLENKKQKKRRQRGKNATPATESVDEPVETPEPKSLMMASSSKCSESDIRAKEASWVCVGQEHLNQYSDADIRATLLSAKVDPVAQEGIKKIYEMCSKLNDNPTDLSDEMQSMDLGGKGKKKEKGKKGKRGKGSTETAVVTKDGKHISEAQIRAAYQEFLTNPDFAGLHRRFGKIMEEDNWSMTL